MRQAARERRAEEIEAAAQALVVEEGYGAVSMLAVARRAKASNETLYRWYGDKQGLFSALVRRNAEKVAARLRSDTTGLARLVEIGPVLLEMLASPEAFALNRAAAADPTGDLGRELAAGGRETVAPLIADAIAAAQKAGEIGPGEPAEIADTYLSLLIGDLQIRRVIGAALQPDRAAIAARAEGALAKVRRIYPA